MNSRSFALAVSCLVASGCAYPDIEEGGRCTFGASPSRCRSGYVCTPNNVCTRPCDAGQTLECTTEDGGVGTSSCVAASWSACVRPSPACTATQTEACPIQTAGVAFYGERTCQSDGGFGACVEVAASRCTSRPFGICADAGRVFGDDAGCTSLSYGQLPNFADVESCPADQIDNDCDGYVDELFASSAQNACGVGICEAARWSDGRLKAYRTCGDPTCLDSGVLVERLSDAGYLPLDRCDEGIDRDCSGFPRAGPLVFLRRAREAVAVGDSYSADVVAYRLVTVEEAGDGGLQLIFSTWTSALRVAAAASDVGTAHAGDGGPINPRMQMADRGLRSVIGWKSDTASFGLAHAFGNNVTGTRYFASPYPLLDSPEIAQVGSSVVVAAQFIGSLIDGGPGPITYLSAIGDGLPSGSSVDAGTIVPDVPVKLEGDGSELAGVFARLIRSSAWLELGLDAGLVADGFFPYFDVYARFRTTNNADGDFMALTTVGDRKFTMAVTSRIVEVSSFTVNRSSYDAATLLPSQLDDDVRDLVLVARDLPDGGETFLAGGVLSGGSVGVFDKTAMVRSLGPTLGRASLAITPEVPGYALLTRPMAIDGGTAVFGQLVCMPP